MPYLGKQRVPSLKSIYPTSLRPPYVTRSSYLTYNPYLITPVIYFSLYLHDPPTCVFRIFLLRLDKLIYRKVDLSTEFPLSSRKGKAGLLPFSFIVISQMKGFYTISPRLLQMINTPHVTWYLLVPSGIFLFIKKASLFPYCISRISLYYPAGCFSSFPHFLHGYRPCIFTQSFFFFGKSYTLHQWFITNVYLWEPYTLLTSFATGIFVAIKSSSTPSGLCHGRARFLCHCGSRNDKDWLGAPLREVDSHIIEFYVL